MHVKVNSKQRTWGEKGKDDKWPNKTTTQMQMWESELLKGGLGLFHPCSPALSSTWRPTYTHWWAEGMNQTSRSSRGLTDIYSLNVWGQRQTGKTKKRTENLHFPKLLPCSGLTDPPQASLLDRPHRMWTGMCSHESSSPTNMGTPAQIRLETGLPEPGPSLSQNELLSPLQ